MKRLFVVTITREVLIVADSPENAVSYAEHGDLDGDDIPDIRAVRMDSLPAGWESDSIPYGYRAPGDEDRTVQEWIDAGAAPEYTALLAKLEALKPGGAL